MLTSNPLHGTRKPGTVGLPLSGVDLRIVDGSPGSIEVRGPNVFSGYWQRPELRDSEFTADGWFKTGDIGQIDEDGYVEIVGRSKDLVITGGLNVYPKEVEQALDALPLVLESAVFGLADADFGETVTAAVVLTPGATVDSEELRQQARLVLAAFKVPKRIHIVSALPRNAMGKVEKARLRNEYLHSPID
jgi:malonyl-CoA/methylmalonyl-CoA synthetase